MSVEDAGKLLGVSRGVAYEAARRGALPSLRLGRRVVVPLAALEKLLHEAPGTLSAEVSAEDEGLEAEREAAGIHAQGQPAD
jgi:excisionase family DNA binding protein